MAPWRVLSKKKSPSETGIDVKGEHDGIRSLRRKDESCVANVWPDWRGNGKEIGAMVT